MSKEKLTRDMFETVRKLGEGSYAKVYLVRKKDAVPEELYALKQVDKDLIIKHGKVDSVHRERDILMIARHPNIVHFDCTFMDDANLYFLLEYAENRSLSELLRLISKPCLIIILCRATASGVDEVLCGGNCVGVGVHPLKGHSAQRPEAREYLARWLLPHQDSKTPA